MEKEEVPLQAVLLADSFTTTFRPASFDKPKVLCPLNNVKMLDYSIDFLVGSGVAELFVFSVHLAEQGKNSRRHSKSGGWKWFCALVVFGFISL